MENEIKISSKGKNGLELLFKNASDETLTDLRASWDKGNRIIIIDEENNCKWLLIFTNYLNYDLNQII